MQILKNKSIRRLVIAGFAVGALAAIAGFGYLAYILISGGSGEISEDISERAEQLETEEEGDLLFRIIPAESEVRFKIDEVLRGEDFTVVGTTRQVGGDIIIRPSDIAATEIGPITINLRDLRTDDDRRDRAIRGQILKSAQDEYEFTTFRPTVISGLPETREAIVVGTPFTFQVTGDLTLVERTRTITFEMTVTPESETRISGFGVVQITLDQFDLNLPPLPPIVASVEDEIILEIDFVAELVSEDGRQQQSIVG